MRSHEVAVPHIATTTTPTTATIVSSIGFRLKPSSGSHRVPNFIRRLVMQSQSQQGLSDALTAINAIEDEHSRITALVEIAPQLPESAVNLQQHALAIARTFQSGEYRVKAFVALAPQLPESARLIVLEQALAIAAEIEHERRKSEILIEIASCIEISQVELLQQALNLAQAIADENLRAVAVSAITFKLSETLQVEYPSQHQLTDQRLSVLRKPHRAQCFTEPAISLDLMLIPGGTFTMGSPPEELGRYDDEGPQYGVAVSSFLMGRYPVTQAQWRAIAIRTDLKVNHDLDPDPSAFKGDDHPVERVSWHEAIEFCNRLSGLTGHTYRLPTEAEWEYACRAGTTTPFHFGETITTDLANYRGADRESQPDELPGHYGKGPKGEYRKTTTPVLHFYPLANAFGLCDMHGNVWEWCLDHWHDSYEGAPIDGSARLTENESSGRVLRGGSWFTYPRDCRSASRYDLHNPGNRDDNVGFRVLCESRGL